MAMQETQGKLLDRQHLNVSWERGANGERARVHNDEPLWETWSSVQVRNVPACRCLKPLALKPLVVAVELTGSAVVVEASP